MNSVRTDCAAFCPMSYKICLSLRAVMCMAPWLLICLRAQSQDSASLPGGFTAANPSATNKPISELI